MSFHIIGDQDTVLGYRFAGVTGAVVTTAEEARQAFRQAVGSSRSRILLITQAVEDMLTDEVAAHRLASEPPYLVVVEDIWGSRGPREGLEELIYEAVGIRIVKEEKS